MILKRLSLVLLAVLLIASPAKANSITAGDIAEQLICQCGCTLVLASCTHSECMSRDTMTTLIEQKLVQGQSEEEIIRFFVAQYGEQVLALPPKQGFNLVAWLLPFAAILGGGGVIYIALKKWVRQGSHSQISTVVEEKDEEYQHQLDKELKEFTERGFR